MKAGYVQGTAGRGSLKPWSIVCAWALCAGVFLALAGTSSAADYFTELFTGDNDLDYQSLTFTPDGSGDYYSACRDDAVVFPTDPAGHSVLTLSDDGFVQVLLTGGAAVSLYGNSYSDFYIGANGYITFGGGDSDFIESLAQHFSIPRISGLFDDLYPPGGGTISWSQLVDRVVVTFDDVTEIGTSNTNSFQFELFYDGTIRLTHLQIDATHGLAGLSEGLGVPGDFVESDLSAYGSCTPDYFTELFSGADNDLDYQSLTFTPDGSVSYYSVCRDETGVFPTDPTGHSVLVLGDDNFVLVTLTGGAMVSLYGNSYSNLYIGSNGYITFGAGDTAFTESVDGHFDLPRISALYDDLRPPSGGAVTWSQLIDRVVVTFDEVTEYLPLNTNSFQFELFYDGTIRLTHLRVDVADGLAGLSEGLGVPLDFVESDLSAYPSCGGCFPPPVPYTPVPGNGATGVPTDQDLGWNGAMRVAAMSRQPRASTTLDDFEDGNIDEYGEFGGLAAASNSAAAAHDGLLGLIDDDAVSDGWLIRTDGVVNVSQGDVFSVWVHTPATQDNSRAYFAFGASQTQAISAIVAPNSSQLLIQYNPNWTYSTLASASQTYTTSTWYRLEVDWRVAAVDNIIVNLYGSDGTTLLNSITGTSSAITSGSIGFRAFNYDVGNPYYWDTVTRGEQPAVLVCGAELNLSWLGNVATNLLGTGRFASVDTFNVASATPSLVQLQAYNAVLVWPNVTYADSTALGNNLADYFDGGGGVVCATFEHLTGANLQGRWAAEAYNVMNAGGLLSGTPATLGTVYDAGHPIMSGVSSFSGGSNSWHSSVPSLTAGSTLVADWSDGYPLVAVKDIAGSHRADLNFYPVSSDARGDFWDVSTDGALLMANALTWVAGAGGQPPCTTTYDVYFDVVNPPVALICNNTPDLTCDPGPLAEATTYFWKVIASNPSGTSTGPVWSFTTTGPGVITGSKWFDADADGLWGGSEPPIPNWEIYADLNTNGVWDGGEPREFTAADGSYALVLDPGEYWVREVQLSGWSQTYPTVAVYDPVNDGSFENGPPPASAWWETNNWGVGSKIGTWAATYGVPMYDGDYAFWIGGYGGGVPDPLCLVTQTVVVPVGTDVLAFQYLSYRLSGDDPSPDGDRAYATINGIEVWGLDMVVANDTYPAWTQALVNVSAYQGQTISLGFGGVSVGSGTGNVLIDHIRWSIGSGPGSHVVTLGPGDIVTNKNFGNVGALDWGDAPDPLYPTLAANNGAAHGVAPSSPLRLGALIDAEADGQPLPAGLGDDQAGLDDEDGVVFKTLLMPGGIAGIEVTASAAGLFSAWFDWEADGDWTGPGEAVFVGLGIGAGPTTLSFVVPATAALGPTFARFRFSSAGESVPTGVAADGEVEDYRVIIEAPEVGSMHTLFNADFTDLGGMAGPDGMAPQDDPTSPTNLWHVTALRSASPPYAYYYGQEATQNYETGARNAGSIITPPVSLVGARQPVVLSFKYFLQTEMFSPGYDAATVEVSSNGGGSWNMVARNDTGSGALVDWSDGWRSLFADLSSYIGTNVIVRFNFDTGDGIGNEYEGWYLDDVIIADGQCAKWRQPPDCEHGIDMYSSSEDDGWIWRVVADDWLCDGRPIKALRWWGSYVGRTDPVPPLVYPDERPGHFRITWYTDDPADPPTEPHSEPDVVLKELIVPLADYGLLGSETGMVYEQYYCTVSNKLGPVDTEYEYVYTLQLAEPWIEKEGNVYWIRIDAVYQAFTAPPQRWGWLTSYELDTIDDAVVWDQEGFPPLDIPWKELSWLVYPWPEFWQLVGGYSLFFNPDSEWSINMAFELITDVCPARCKAFEQPPDMVTGLDRWSWYYEAGGVDIELADDFTAFDSRRVTDIHWWGSYSNWNTTEVYTETNPPPMPWPSPDAFRITLYEDGPGDVVTSIVVAVEKCHEVFYGTVEQAWNPAVDYEHEFQYYVDLLDPAVNPGGAWNVPDDYYFLGIQAVYFAPPENPWGWKIATTTPDGGDSLGTRVSINDGPWTVDLLPLIHPRYGEQGGQYDLAFELTTTDIPDPMSWWWQDVVFTNAEALKAANEMRLQTVGYCGCGSQTLQESTNLLDTAGGWTDVETRSVLRPQNEWIRNPIPGHRNYRIKITP